MKYTPEQLRVMARIVLSAKVDPAGYMLFIELLNRLNERCGLSQRNVVELIRRLAA